MSEEIFIKNGILVTLDKSRRIIENGAVVIRNDKIIAVGKTEDLAKDHGNAATVIDAKNKAI